MLRSPSRRIVCAGISVALAFGALVHVAAAEADQPDDAATAQAEDAPFVEAANEGHQVEIEDLRTETDTVYAQPDGSVKRSISSSPIRVETEDGWEPINTDLRVDDDGKLRPIAAPGNVELSNGQDGPLIRTDYEGVKTAIGWPTDLPEPVIDGGTATYPNVLDDVDLRVTVSDAGISQVLIVKNAAAAANPELRKITLPLDVEGGSIEKNENGGLSYRDEFDREVGTSNEPTMWDSSGAVLNAAGNPKPDTSEGAIDARSVAPAEGDDVAELPTSVTDDAITLRPPAAALTGEDVQYPVYIDPDSSMHRNMWAMVFKQHPDLKTINWKNDGESQPGQGVGYQNWTSPPSTKRLFWKFDLPSSLAGAHVYSAEFAGKLLWSSSCTKTTVKLRRVSSISSSTTWNNQPDWGTEQDTVKAAGGRGGTDCSAQPTLEFNATQAAASVASSRASSLSLGLIAADETDPLSWKRFSYAATFTVHYSNAPSKPSSLSMTSPTAGCGGTIGPDAPRLKAKIVDKDSSDSIRASFEVYKGSTVTEANKIWTDREPYKSQKATNNIATTNVDVPLLKSNGKFVAQKYSWRVRGTDNSNTSSSGLTGAWSGLCSFTVDPNAPVTPDVSWDEKWEWSLGGDGHDVDISPNGSADVVKYGYSINKGDEPAKYVPANPSDKKATITVKPSKTGLNTLRVWSYDLAGNRSAVPAIQDFEAIGMGVYSAYNFNDVSTPSSTSTADVKNRFALALVSGQSNLRGHFKNDVGQQVADYDLNFLSAAADKTTAPVVDTSDSFTVSAWIGPADISGPRTAVSQSTSSQSTFKLGIETKCEVTNEDDTPVVLDTCYAFSVLDPVTGKYVRAVSPSEADDSEVVHVIGTYAAGDKSIALWMFTDGQLVDVGDAEVEHGVAASTGPLVVGGSKPGTTLTAPWLGEIDNLLVGQGVASAADLLVYHAEADHSYIEDQE